MNTLRPDMVGESNPRWNGGCSRYPEYMNYRNMIRRGRMTIGSYAGINVCYRWQESFWNFYEDMGAKPTTGRYTVDRIDTTKGYSPENCRWATASEQRLNTNKRTFSEQAKENIRKAALGNTNKKGKYKVPGEPSRTTYYRHKRFAV